ncbi:Uncharacterized protein APZ42_027407 [Daphnia magna]|uniref:Uncharacterized protein n=1 Tax=Daphnia magna TaxID=35525 RepID=A0A164RIR9_9CRUS|nr:Uncharacterized protein APZ42_027407 [Daphnia magna]
MRRNGNNASTNLKQKNGKPTHASTKDITKRDDETFRGWPTYEAEPTTRRRSRRSKRRLSQCQLIDPSILLH